MDEISTNNKTTTWPTNFDEAASDESELLIILYITIAIILVLSPCFHSGFRLVCIRRIRQRRWNVQVADIQARSVLTSRSFRPRYPRGDARHVVSKKEAEETRKNFMISNLKDYSKTIDDCLFESRSDKGIQSIDPDGERTPSLLSGLRRYFHSGGGKSSIQSSKANDEIQDVETGNQEKQMESTSTVDTESTLESEGTFIQERELNEQDLQLMIKLPLPGMKAPLTCANSGGNGSSTDVTNEREIIAECSICLSEFKDGERICWSPTQSCSHAFHEKCIVEWFLTQGRNADLKRHRATYEVDYAMCCPVCRQAWEFSSPNCENANAS